MKYTIFEASGGVGQQLLEQAVADLALIKDTVRDSGLDWTTIRPNGLTDQPLTGTYRTA